MFQNNIVNISEKLNKQILLKICMQVQILHFTLQISA